MKTKKINNFIINIILIVVSYAAISVIINSGMLSRQMTSLIIPIGVNIILAVSLNLLTGFLGELTLGHAGFMSLGAYTGALITVDTELPAVIGLPLALIAGGIVAAIFGLIIGIPVLRLKGDYLAIVTLAFGEIIKSVLTAMEFTGGAKGLSGIPKYTTYKNYTIVFVFVVLTILLIKNLVHSRHGRAICSVRDNYIASEAIGIKISRYKIMAFVISAFFAGIAGVFNAHNIGILKPDNFDYNKSIEILVIVVLGGMGNIKGSVIAAVVLTLLPELLRDADNFRMLFYAIVLIAMMLFNNSGLKERLTGRLKSKKQVKTAEGGE